MTAEAKQPRVVILGAGFGGLWTARALGGAPVEVLLIDRNNYHTFLPLLYQVAAAELEAEQIAYPVRNIVRAYDNVHFVMAEVVDADLTEQVIVTADQRIDYDYLVMALGSTAAYFGVAGAEKHSWTIKDIHDGISLRNHILRLFEQAAQVEDEDKRERMLTFAIVGGGPTGVEYAGAVQELISRPLARDFPMLDVARVRVILLEGLDELLPGMADSLGDYAERRLRQMGVDVRTGTMVSEVTETAVHVEDGPPIATETVVWTAGVRGHPVAEAAGLPLDDQKRVDVLPTLQAPDHPNVYVIGDLTAFEQDGQPLPMLAPVATQQGSHVGANIRRQLEGQAPISFRYKDRGQMATVGRNAAVAEIYGRKFTGFLAWIIWLGVHLFNLIGFRNRIIVFINWAWSYIFFERVVRLILPVDEEGARVRDRE